MPNDYQAEADSQEVNKTVEDPLDASDALDHEATELDKYSQFVDELEESEQGGYTADDTEEESPESDSEESSGEEFQEEDQFEEENPEDEEESNADEAEESENQDGEEEEETPENNTSNRFRIRAQDEVESEALSLRKRHPDWSLEQCITKAKDLLGVAEQSNQETDGEASEAVRTTADVASEIEQLRKEHREATTGLDFEKAAELFDQIENLRDEREQLRITEFQQKNYQEQQEHERFETQFSSSENKAVQFYPDATDPDSPLTKRIIELNQQMQDLDDPLYRSPDKPFILAKQAAKELGIPMHNPKNAVAKKQGSSTRRLIQPASGNARTTPKDAPAGKLEEQLGKIDSLEAYEDFAESL